MQDVKQKENESLERVLLNDEFYFKISDIDKIPVFFMSIVSDSNHWMFISSNGGLTAGRKNAENALFPYYTDDKITESYETTGSKSILWLTIDGKQYLWEPFSQRNERAYQCTNNLYKGIYGNKILFEEINHDLGITFRYEWSSSNKYGFVRNSHLINNANQEIRVELLDGIQNIMPYGVTSELQAVRSNLVDAYKRNELEKDCRLGIYSLSAIIVDRAEPSEALKANVAWSLNTKNAKFLVSSIQLDKFRKGLGISEELDIKASKGAYFVHHKVVLEPMKDRQWLIIANVNQGASDIARLANEIESNEQLQQHIETDIKRGTQKLIDLVSASDGFQLTADKRRDSRHFSNTLFNIMRGGIFDHNYRIEKWDFEKYLRQANNKVFEKNQLIIEGLPDRFSHQQLRQLVKESHDKDFARLSLEYMPLKFSRRHGDPSRPWNKFSINTRSEIDGSKILDYEGNWRDIFQNWEALAHAYPDFIDSMILKFLNASTFDGYNPYRVTKSGFDWETIEPNDPWSYIGYWGDHQIIYLLKFLEFVQDYDPNRLEVYFQNELFVYANVPYRIKNYEAILSNPKDTIVFDEVADHNIREKRAQLGADGALLTDKENQVYRANFIEKILVTMLAKVSNFIPEAGIWMNTQRPEWNDANNALVGNGVSMVTLYYLRRFAVFFNQLLQNSSFDQVEINDDILELYLAINDALKANENNLLVGFSDKARKSMTDSLGIAASKYRTRIYENGFSRKRKALVLKELESFNHLLIEHLDHTIKVNKRSDDMFHAYNLMTVNGESEISISRLSEMLEGQVAVLSSGYLTAEASLILLNGLKESKLFREDQYSYILYPNKALPGFMDKNIIPNQKVQGSDLLTRLVEEGNTQIIEKDINGVYHFNGDFNNADSLSNALDELPDSYKNLLNEEKTEILEIFESVFDHKSFTGRSGTFYGYEGLGSIYWHMVSKLALAVEEICLKAIKDQEPSVTIGKLLAHYYEINEGIGVHKSPKLYGAFPVDPYSHTPFTKGAQQPGMTGQVKEDILCRKAELGAYVSKGQLSFDPHLLRQDEFLQQESDFRFTDIHQQTQSIKLTEGMLGFTYCQVPVIYQVGDQASITVLMNNDLTVSFDDTKIDRKLSKKVFIRSGEIQRIDVIVNRTQLK